MTCRNALALPSTTADINAASATRPSRHTAVDASQSASVWTSSRPRYGPSLPSGRDLPSSRQRSSGGHRHGLCATAAEAVARGNHPRPEISVRLTIWHVDGTRPVPHQGNRPLTWLSHESAACLRLWPGSVPFELHSDSTRLYRREQLQVVGQSREARWR